MSRLLPRRPLPKTNAEWRSCLTPEQFRVLREKGTEAPFSGPEFHGDGTFRCAGCGAALFASDAKFESGTGWPSFTTPASKGAIEETTDETNGMHRTEVLCAMCHGHLGHVFPDGPGPTGMRYCINAAALAFDHSSPIDPSEAALGV